MKLIERTHDVVTGSSELDDLHTLHNFPVFMGAVDFDQSNDLCADMSWSIARESGLIQLKKLLPLNVLYQAQTTTSAIGPTWLKHHKAFAKFISERSPASILEIGGAHGILSKEYEIYGAIPWTILEPNPSPVAGCRAEFIKGYFDEGFVFYGEHDTVVHSHVFEHMYEPDIFMANLGRFIKEGQKMIFSVPNLLEWLKRKYTNCINFEHSIFLTDVYIEYLLAKHGFKVLTKEDFMDGHSIFYETIKGCEVHSLDLPADLYDQNKSIYEEFVKFYVDLILDLNKALKNIEGDVYLFGAHIFTQYLLAYGLDQKSIIGILDNDPEKCSKRLYGTNLKIYTPEELRGKDNAVVILRAGIYNEEIKNQIINEINENIIFL